MRRQLALVSALTLALIATPIDGAAAGSSQDTGSVIVLRPVAHDVGGSLSHIPQAYRSLDTSHRALLLRSGGGKPGGGGGGGGNTDGALQTTANGAAATTAGSVNVDGVGVGSGGSTTNCCTPADTNLAVGTLQAVQWVNLEYAAFDKTTGALTLGPTPGNAVWAGFGGGCDTNNDGDPIVKFDAQNKRWLMTQFSVTTRPYLQCVAVSQTEDFVTTAWNRYAYSFGTSFPDYPKVGIWPDAYYFSFNMFANGSRFSGAAACAFDSAKGRVNGPATMQCFQNGTSVGSLLPGDLDGATGAVGSTALPPANAPAYFANFGTNTLNTWRFHADFTTPSNSTFTAGPAIATASFTPACGGGACVAQAGTSQKLDSLADRLMYRLAYRNFGGYQSLVVTHSVTGSGTSAPRWYELRDTGTGLALYQQSSYAPDATYRWMGSAAQDKQGNLAVGYSASSGSISPEIRYAGRLAGDTLGKLRTEVSVPLPSTGSNTGPYSRWGDYSSLSLDPADDCTMWYTTMYLKTSGDSFSWSTRIANFKFTGCN